MRKIVIFIMGLVLLSIVSISVLVLLPNFSRNYKLPGYNLNLKVPYNYKKVEQENENSLLNLYEAESGITISAMRLKNDFWSSGDTASRVEEYIKVISSANYDSEIKNIKTGFVNDSKNKLGLVEFELGKPNGTYKTVTIISNEEIGNITIEIYADKESFNNNLNEIETIVSSIKARNY